MNLNWIVGILLAGTMAAVGFLFFRPVQLQTIVKQLPGAVSTLDGVDNSFLSIGGKRLWIGTKLVSASSTNVCVMKNPFSATSSIDDIQLHMPTNNHGSISFDVSTSSNGFSTSTGVIGRFTGATAGQLTQYDWRPMYATTTDETTSGSTLLNGFLLEKGPATVGTSRMILGPTEFVIIRAATSSAGGSTWAAYSAGQCGFQFSKI